MVRNNYFQPAMSELMAACVEIWESDPETLHYHGSGYIALGDGDQEADLTTVAERQERIGYESELILGEAEVADHMKRDVPRLARARPVGVPARAPRRLRVQQGVDLTAWPRRRWPPGAEIAEGVEVTGFEHGRLGRRHARADERGRRATSSR